MKYMHLLFPSIVFALTLSVFASCNTRPFDSELQGFVGPIIDTIESPMPGYTCGYSIKYESDCKESFSIRWREVNGPRRGNYPKSAGATNYFYLRDGETVTIHYTVTDCKNEKRDSIVLK